MKTRVKFKLGENYVEGYIDGYVGDAYACVVVGDKIHHVSIAKLTVIPESLCTPEKKLKLTRAHLSNKAEQSNQSPSE